MPVKRLRWLAAALLATVLAGVLLQPVSVVRVVTDDGETLACRRIGRDATATLIFTHSMYGGEVRETWRAEGNTLVRVRIETDNAAAAEYYATNGETLRTASGFEVVSSPLEADALAFRIDRIGNHRLRFGDEEIRLAERVDGSIGATLSAAQVPLVARIVDSDAGCGG